MRLKPVGWLKKLRLTLLLLGCVLAQQTYCAGLPAGTVVWWGKDDFWKHYYSTHTNGLIENGNDILSNVVAVAGRQWQGLALKSDGTVFGFGGNFIGGNNVPAGLSNVVSIAVAGNSCWAIRRDGTVARWGNEISDHDVANIVTGLSNITSITWGGYRNYLALKNDGTLVGFRFDEPATGKPDGLIRPVKVRGQILSNVMAVASMNYTPLVLKGNGTVFRLGYQTPGVQPVQPQYEVHDNVLYEQLGGESAQLPYQYTSADPVMIDGQALSNVVTLASEAELCLALKRNGTVVAWRNDTGVTANVPAGLSNVMAIATAGQHCLALKRDGTVMAWGDNNSGQTNVPAGLSNVVAIAAAMDFSLAVTTSPVPSSVFIQPHGELEKLAAESALVFKGRVISTHPETNAAFPSWGKPYATEFEVISVLQGIIHPKTITFRHITGSPLLWSGPEPPRNFKFEGRQSYLVFAAKADTPDWFYAPATNGVARTDDFRQLMHGEIAFRTLDARPLDDLSLKEAYWLELNRLLNNANPTNQLYAIDKLDRLSLAGGRIDEWWNKGDFKRETVLNALLPLVTNRNGQVAGRAMSCFAVESNAATVLKPLADTLIKVAMDSPSSPSRLSAIKALSDYHDEALANSLAQLLHDPDQNIRLDAVRLLPRFSPEFAERHLREMADDESASVRSVVADVIGDEKYVQMLPTLVKLFADPVGKEPLIEPLTMEQLKAGERWNKLGDVHTSAGLALVKFAPDQVADILKTNLDDAGFHINFVAKLAQGNPEPWLPELVRILETRCAYVETIAKFPADDPRRYADPLAGKILTGAYAKCWEDIRQYLLKQPPEKLAGGEMDRYLDLLEKTVQPVPGCAGCCVQEARWLYQLYWNKNLTLRVANLRRQYDKTDGWWFDDFNKGIRDEADPVNAITF